MAEPTEPAFSDEPEADEVPHPPAASAPYPFTAIVGQTELKLALLLCVVDPGIGGVMVMGHRGTAKSTAVRALAALLPPVRVVASCPYNCAPERPAGLCEQCNGTRKRRALSVPVPVVDLPLGATEDRICGTLDIERALTQGVQSFAPGLLARANRGFLYIDEVNLLEDHLVDVLLDVAASGVNLVEREGISIRHPARFVLVGSGNPEEGDLRPQLLDRFGLHARIVTLTDVAERVEIVKRRRAYDADSVAFAGAWEKEQNRLRRQTKAAQKRLPTVELSDAVLYQIAEICVRLAVDGHRGELTISRAATALAAFEKRETVTAADVRRVAVLALRHRLRKDPLEMQDDDERIRQVVDDVLA
ncbi:MAG: magnesium chelatase ATPase subunit I [Chloroflexaceae bacterium]|nr:magnesium chelatase ATPase subunit I [Chloroflexaceae bacterium]NJO05397.1 magnesium chelatase ATPase subunit I [Chloroflexaceae bacterium]